MDEFFLNYARVSWLLCPPDLASPQHSRIWSIQFFRLHILSRRPKHSSKAHRLYHLAVKVGKEKSMSNVQKKTFCFGEWIMRRWVYLKLQSFLFKRKVRAVCECPCSTNWHNCCFVIGRQRTVRTARSHKGLCAYKNKGLVGSQTRVKRQAPSYLVHKSLLK